MFLANLFAKNPFTPLREHMKKTMECVEKSNQLFAACFASDQEAVKEIAVQMSILEHEADVIKHEIRSRLTSSVFLPVDRREVLEVLQSMDSVADHAEDIGVLMTLRQMEPMPKEMQTTFETLCDGVNKVVRTASEVIDSFDALLESGFSGPDAEAVLKKVDEVGRLEHEADKAQDVFGKTLFRHEDELKPAALFMWIKIANKVGDIANASERMCNQLRIMLANR